VRRTFFLLKKPVSESWRFDDDEFDGESDDDDDVGKDEGDQT